MALSGTGQQQQAPDEEPESAGLQQQQQQQPQGMCVCSLSPVLRLHPHSMERDFWDSPAVHTLCNVLDTISLLMTVLNHCLIVGRNGLPPWGDAEHPIPNASVVPTLIFILAALLQLSFRAYRPDTYKAHRFKLAAANRLARLTIVIGYTATCDQHTFAWLMAGSSSRAARPGGLLQSAHKLSGVVLSPHLVNLNHINFITSFRIAWPLQVITTAAHLVLTKRLSACYVYARPDMQQLAEYACQNVRQAMGAAAGFLLGGALALAADHDSEGCDAAECVCKGVEASVMINMYAAVVLVLIVPCIVLFMLELHLKVNFLHNHGVELRQLWAGVMAGSVVVRTTLAVSALVVAWYVCEYCVAAAAPMTCDSSDGSLQFNVTHQWLWRL